MKIGHLPFVNLGVPIFRRSPTINNLMPIVDKILSRFDIWKGKYFLMLVLYVWLNMLIFLSLSTLLVFINGL